MTVDEESRPLLRLLKLLSLPPQRHFSFHTNIFVVNNRYCWGAAARLLPWNSEDYLEILDLKGPEGQSV